MLISNTIEYSFSSNCFKDYNILLYTENILKLYRNLKKKQILKTYFIYEYYYKIIKLLNINDLSHKFKANYTNLFGQPFLCNNPLPEDFFLEFFPIFSRYLPDF